MIEYQRELDPDIKNLLFNESIVTPLAITSVIILLKKMGKNEPKTTRWR
ncbi:hypothetical protein [Prochlorococcus sp. MIT 1223]|nr:hypothetical protein [Prochlorococcus sp. MIT 1223]